MNPHLAAFLVLFALIVASYTTVAICYAACAVGGHEDDEMDAATDAEPGCPRCKTADIEAIEARAQAIVESVDLALWAGEMQP